MREILDCDLRILTIWLRSLLQADLPLFLPGWAQRLLAVRVPDRQAESPVPASSAKTAKRTALRGCML